MMVWYNDETTFIKLNKSNHQTLFTYLAIPPFDNNMYHQHWSVSLSLRSGLKPIYNAIRNTQGSLNIILCLCFDLQAYQSSIIFESFFLIFQSFNKSDLQSLASIWSRKKDDKQIDNLFGDFIIRLFLIIHNFYMSRHDQMSWHFLCSDFVLCLW